MIASPLNFSAQHAEWTRSREATVKARELALSARPHTTIGGGVALALRLLDRCAQMRREGGK